MEVVMKTAQVRVSFDGADWRNLFTMQSPTGRSVTLDCNGKWDKMSGELLSLINKYQFADAAETPWRAECEETVTYDMMAEVLRLSAVR
jgi:hypothetical protein